MSRLERLLGTARPQGHGLEIGALNAPLARRPEHDVRYVDYAPTAVIKANQFDPAIKISDIVDVDLVWGAEPLLTLAGGQVDYVVASHVIEHVPDLIGWLLEIADVLRPGGVLGLAIPDKRFTFDALRKTMALSEAVEAYLARSRQPSIRQVFEAASLGVAVDAGEVWAGAFDESSRRQEVLSRLPSALALARSLSANPRYNDAHCWVFTPASFLDLAEELCALELFPFAIEAFSPTETGTIEFHVRLAKADRKEAEKIQASIAAARASLSSPLEEASPSAPELAALASKVELLGRRLDEIHASTSWKITAPLRALRRALQV